MDVQPSRVGFLNLFRNNPLEITDNYTRKWRSQVQWSGLAGRYIVALCTLPLYLTSALRLPTDYRIQTLCFLAISERNVRTFLGVSVQYVRNISKAINTVQYSHIQLIFRRVRKIAKSDYQLCHICPSALDKSCREA